MKYYPHTPGEVKEMLAAVGAESLDALFSDIPGNKKIQRMGLPAGRSEMEVTRLLGRLSDLNREHYQKPCFTGAGAYGHFVPAVVDSVISRSEFYTAYTPYQAEASQGTLQAIFEYQTLVCMLTGMDVSNASHYDGATACAESVSMAAAATRKNKVFYSEGLHPEYVEVLKTYYGPAQPIELVEIPLKDGVTDIDFIKENVSKETAGVIVQNPNCLGFIEDAETIGKTVKESNKKTFYIMAVTEPFSLGILKNPGQCGADVAVGEGAGLGIPLSYGGPYLGIMATAAKHLRRLPGRLVGQTTDADGKRAFCLTLQTREQHIRREKAASNICTNQGLCALAATVFMSCVGKKGFRSLAELNLSKAHYLKDKICSLEGCELFADRPFFNEFTVRTPHDPEKLAKFLRKNGVTGGFVTGRWNEKWQGCMTFCATELHEKRDIKNLVLLLESYRGEAE